MIDHGHFTAIASVGMTQFRSAHKISPVSVNWIGNLVSAVARIILVYVAFWWVPWLVRIEGVNVEEKGSIVMIAL
tara:strand:+ start:207 stop:431 length:225 start_codon:yes stop_codon:yes gene_type:complete